jgi:Zn-dependent protease
MLRSWKLGTAFGIGIYVHPTFVLLPLWALGNTWFGGGGLVQCVYSLVLLFAVFACVVLHELGHALMARHFGIPTLRITLSPIGGVAQLERMNDRPWEEFWIALAGPAVNVGIAFLLFWPLLLGGIFSDLLSRPGQFARFVDGHNLLLLLWLSNIMLVVFNMLPAFPMDGGRVLRALLATQLSQLQATCIAVGLGTVLAILFGSLVTYFARSPWPLLIGGFVFIVGHYELAALRHREAQRRAEPIDVLPVADPVPGPAVAPATPVLEFVWDGQAGGWVERHTRRPLSVYQVDLN